MSTSLCFNQRPSGTTLRVLTHSCNFFADAVALDVCCASPHVRTETQPSKRFSGQQAHSWGYSWLWLCLIQCGWRDTRKSSRKRGFEASEAKDADLFQRWQCTIDCNNPSLARTCSWRKEWGLSLQVSNGAQILYVSDTDSIRWVSVMMIDKETNSTIIGKPFERVLVQALKRTFTTLTLVLTWTKDLSASTTKTWDRQWYKEWCYTHDPIWHVQSTAYRFLIAYLLSDYVNLFRHQGDAL